MGGARATLVSKGEEETLIIKKDLLKERLD
jgi:hypothetical protein